jgi:hypothetical protein
VSEGGTSVSTERDAVQPGSQPRFLFASDSHAAAPAEVAYALERREPLVVITGEIGTGKTLLCRLFRSARTEDVRLGHQRPSAERDDLPKQLLRTLASIWGSDQAHAGELTRADPTLQAFRPLSDPAHAVVIIDEACTSRTLSRSASSRTSTTSADPAADHPAGQTDPEPLLSRPELRQSSSVSRRFQLKPLNANEVQHIEHRVCAGARHGAIRDHCGQEQEPTTGTREESKPGVEFTPDAIRGTKLSGGLPRGSTSSAIARWKRYTSSGCARSTVPDQRSTRAGYRRRFCADRPSAERARAGQAGRTR